MTTTTATATARDSGWPRTGWALTGFAALFLTFDTVIKLIAHPMAVAGTVALGYPAHLVTVIGVIELICLVLYLVPATSVFGAVMLTGYLGGAIATHLRIGSPLSSATLFPIYVALLVWGGVYLRDGRLRALIPLRRG